MVERPFQDAVGSLKMVAGTAYMIRADLLREIGWGTSITEDWELTLKLYARGYKVAYTPWAETPAECVSTFSRLARQRMRWAEGHTYNVRRYFFPILLSPFVSFLEKVEFLFDTTYYLQAAPVRGRQPGVAVVRGVLPHSRAGLDGDPRLGACCSPTSWRCR